MLKAKDARFGMLVFVSSAVVMMFEIVGSRIMSPYFGSTVYTWASLISVVLLALSVGYYIGGLMADKNMSVRQLAWLINLAALSLLGVVIFKNDLLPIVYQLEVDIRIKALLAAQLIAGFPSFFLAMIYPYAVRLQLKSVGISGRVVGVFYALSSLGSVIGTLVAAFLMLPYFGVEAILAVFVVILVVAGLIVEWGHYLIIRALLVIAALIVMGVFSFSGQATKDSGLIREESMYSEYVVFDGWDDGLGARGRYLTDSVWGRQSGFILEGEEMLPFEYLRFYRMGGMWVDDHKRALMIGGGVYSYPRDHVKRFPDSMIDVVELDPKLMEVAVERFGFEESERIRVYHNDGRVYLRGVSENTYDLIFIDAFSSGFIPPSHMTTQEFFKEVDRVLKPGGVVIMNTIASLDGVGSEFLWSEYKTIKSVFRQVEYYLASNEPLNNIMLVGTQGSLQNPELEGVTTSFKRGEASEWRNRGVVLTDSYSPIEHFYYGGGFPFKSSRVGVGRFEKPSFWSLLVYVVDGIR